MGRFLESEKRRLTKFKTTSAYFSLAARVDGIYKGKPRPFCLPLACAEENLFASIRSACTAYFAQYQIKWHDGRDRRPSVHLCDSQVCCVNFLYPFADKPAALAELLRPYFPDVHHMLPVENGGFVAFEWIGQENYLREKNRRRDGVRTRGANFTSADAAVIFERQDGKRHFVLIEWKYTESYRSTSLKMAKSGTDRTAIYAPLFEREDCPLHKKLLPGFEALFYEPFYQLMRQQLLAHEMERANELGAEIVTLLHIAPEHNGDFKRVTSPELRPLGESATEVWNRLLLHPNRFASVSTEEMFTELNMERFPELVEWWKYITARYPWLREKV